MDKLVIIKPQKGEMEVQLNEYTEDGWDIQSQSCAFNGSDVIIVLHLHKAPPLSPVREEDLKIAVIDPYEENEFE